MENLVIEGEIENFYTPSVNFNAESGILEIHGESYLEDTKEFYHPLIEWLEKFIAETKLPIIFNIKLTYYNTSSSRSLLEMLYILRTFKDSGGDLTVNWYHEEDDGDTEEEVEDFEIDTGLKINLIEVEEL